MLRRAFMATAGAAAVPASTVLAQEPMPIFDAHIHYSHDAWEVVPPKEAIAILKRAGVRRAMVSSSNDDGTQKLHAEAPDLIVPELRPYRRRGELSTWVREEAVIREMEARLKRYRYVAIGEFHLYGADAELPVPRRMIELAREHKLFLHAHSDIDAVERLFKLDPAARVLWAHSGFAGPEEVRGMLRKHANLWCDLAFRGDHASGGKVVSGWREAFLEFPRRFLVGTDTFTPERWHYIPEHANFSRAWLSDLPKDVAERIAWRTGEEVFGRMMGAAR